MSNSAVSMTYRAFALFLRSCARGRASTGPVKLLCFALALAVVPTARADVAVMVPPRTEQLPNNELLDQAVEELTRLLKLRGFDVISAGQAGPAAEAEQQRGVFPQSYDPLYCLTPECATEYRKLFDATFAVQLTISSRNLRPANVSVVLTENPKAFFGGSAPIEGLDIRAAVRTAFDTARAKQEEGAGPWLSVSGSPVGATVYVDGAEYGRLPFEKRHVESGPHKFEVREDGYLSESRTLSIAARIDHVEVVAVTLAPLDGNKPNAALGSGSKAGSIHRSPWDWVLGGAIVATGAVHLASGIIQKTEAGDCANDACSRRYLEHPTRENLLIGLGAAGVAAGVLVIGLGPIGHLQVRASTDHAVLQWKGKF